MTTPSIPKHSRPGAPARAGLSRRTFLGSAVAVSTPLILGARRPQPMRDDPEVLRVGLIGCGGRGTGAAVQAMQAEQGTVILAAVADVFPDRVDSCLADIEASLPEDQRGRLQVDEEHRFFGFDGYQELIDSDVDVVLLATPPHFRPAHLAAAIAAGKHVFCEKPVAVDAPGVRSVLESIEAARAKKLAVMSGFCWRYNVRHRALVERIHDGAIGAIRNVYTTYNASPLAKHPRQEEWSDMEFQLRNWQHFNWLSGDHVVEQAVHSLDKMAWFLKDESPKRVTAVGGRQARTGPESGNIYDHFSATFDYAGGVKGFHMCRQIANCPFDNSDYIYGEKGNAKIDGWAQVHVIDGENPWEYEGEGNDMYQQEHDELFASIRAGEPVNDGPWMAHSTLLGIMVRMAAYTGQTINWEQALSSELRLGPDAYEWGELPVVPVAVPGETKFL